MEIDIFPIPPTEKRWEYKEFLDEHPESEMKLGGTLLNSPYHHISVGTINSNGMNNNKMDQLLAFMKIQCVGVLCLTDMRLQPPAYKASPYLLRMFQEFLSHARRAPDT